VEVVDRGSVASVSRVKEVCGRYGMRVSLAYKVLVVSSSPTNHHLEQLDWETLTDDELEELVVSWSLELCFVDSPSYISTNFCSEIYLPHGPKICTL
jgi:hypothetical protein